MVIETITSPEMHAIETNAQYYGISLLQLMETAGRNVAEEIALRFNPKETSKFLGNTKQCISGKDES